VWALHPIEHSLRRNFGISTAPFFSTPFQLHGPTRFDPIVIRSARRVRILPSTRPPHLDQFFVRECPFPAFLTPSLFATLFNVEHPITLGAFPHGQFLARRCQDTFGSLRVRDHGLVYRHGFVSLAKTRTKRKCGVGPRYLINGISLPVSKMR
jgi:hypothetical protein